MGPWDDVEVDSDGEELLDWLWDLPDRYDVGVDDDPVAATAAPAMVAPTGVRKHRRPAFDAAPEAFDDRPTEALDPIETYADDAYEYGQEYDATLTPFPLPAPRTSRFTLRELAAGAAVVLVVVAGIGLGYRLFTNGSGTAGRPSNLAIGTATTTVTTFDPVVIPPVVIPTTGDTTTTSTPPTPPTPPTTAPLPSSSVPGGLAVGATTSTTRPAHVCAPTCPTTAATTTTTAVPPATVPEATTTTTTTTTPSTTTSTSTTTTTLAGH
jgi:hypothetical protein